MSVSRYDCKPSKCRVHYEKPDQPVGKQHFSSTCCRTKMVSELELTLGAMSERERLACLGASGPCSKCKRHVATLPPMFFFLKVVNDLASVNIDGQLLRVSLGDVELVELQNGSLIPWVDVESVKDRDRDDRGTKDFVVFSGCVCESWLRHGWALLKVIAPTSIMSTSST